MSAQILNEQGFQKYLNDEFLSQIYNKLNQQKSSIISNVAALVEKTLRESDTYLSLLSGRLRTSFGLADAQTAITEITNTVAQSTIMTTSLLANSVIATVMVLRDDFSEVLQTEGAKYTYQAKPKVTPAGRRLVGGHVEIPWLEWLLFKGDSIIIVDAQIATVSPTPYSRTNNTIMIHPKNPKGWAVPPEFSGIENDNWLTRELEPLGDQVINEIYRCIS